MKPKIICLLGNIASRTFFKKASIGKVRGKTIEKDSCVYFYTYHPAAALYNVSLKYTIYKDIRRIKEILENLYTF